MTSRLGHTELFFRVDDEWRLATVPFPWGTRRVLMVWAGCWEELPLPIEDLRPFTQPVPLAQRDLDFEKPGPKPNRDAYVGMPTDLSDGFSPGALPN